MSTDAPETGMFGKYYASKIGELREVSTEGSLARPRLRFVLVSLTFLFV